MKKFIWIMCSLLFSATVTGQSLEDYLQTAAKNNPKVKASYSAFEAAMQKAPQVSSLPDPTLTMSAFGRMIETRLGRQEAKFSLMQMFPWFGTLKAQKDAATLMAEAGFQQYLDAREELFVEIKSVYAEMYELEETIRFQEENLEVLNTFRELALSKFRNGKTAMVDVVRVDMMRNEAETEISLLKDKKRSIQYRFNALLNADYDNEVVFPEALPEVEGYVQEENLKRDSLFVAHPKMVQLDKQVASFGAQKKAAKKQGLPMLGLGIDYMIIGEKNGMDPERRGQDAIMPMFSVSLPIFRKKHRAKVREAELLSESAEHQKVAVRNKLIAGYEMAKYDLEKAAQRIDLYDRQLESTDQAVKLLLSAYGNSTTDFEEVLRMQQEKLLYQTAKATAEKDRFIAQAQKDYLLTK
ncbi:TolC family protein [Sinomicrobium weinanense]|uniref:TolC family protein n=1 Tax=Sinomicrobium weinanense TaxID=2842200 RepID=A0A926Q3E6_9FLAO|nr:TolC family protein [Sinomicrobium weinanense]MBC9795926.1 TolC family protein [Sinomicrobium weinanense]MBU3124695.1 TolC family protein [Sinomicrobium weinanense]